MRELKQMGVEGVVFGDIQDIPRHEGWVDKVCGELDIKPVKPLWGRDPKRILSDFINRGFEAIVVCVKADLFDKEWLGRKIDRNFVRDLYKVRNESNVHLCGEQGEYHTFVTDGTLFKRCIKILDGKKISRNGYWFLDISTYKLFRK